MECWKRIIKRIVNKIDSIMCCMFLDGVVRKGRYKKAHISFDDVFDTTTVETIKDISMLPTLMKWHEKYGVMVHLYLFYKKGGKCLSQEYMKTVEEQSCIEQDRGGISWLTFAPHEVKDIEKVLALIERKFLSPSVRFHGYKATASDIEKAVDYGMNTFLCDDLHRVSYNLTEKEVVELNQCGQLTRDGCTYLKTCVRLERPVLWQFIKSSRYNTLVIFGHEWAFEYDRERLEIILKVLHQNKIEFI